MRRIHGTLKDNTERDFLWVIEFPLVGWDEEEQRWVAIHHPFTRPVKEDEEKLLKGELSSDLRAQAYDVVLNGTELGGGSIRIHERDLQSAMFKALGVTEEQAREQFGHILDAFSFGRSAPRRPCAGPGPPGHDDLQRGIHP